MFLLDINYTIFTVLGYQMSLVELLGTLFGLWCVWLAAKGKVLNWPVGILNIIFFFALFYQVRLYSDMFLQVVFFLQTIYGWYLWTHPIKEQAKTDKELKITKLTNKNRIIIGIITLICLAGLYKFMLNIHLILPYLFPEPAFAPLRDAFVTLISIVANFIMAKKKIDCWVLWIIVDIVSCVYYFQAGIALVGLEYIIFGIIATKGFFEWRKEMIDYD